MWDTSASASSRSRNSRHSRAFSLPLGRRHRNSSHTVRASSIRLKPEQSRTISWISVISRPLKARPENLVVGAAIAAGGSLPYDTVPKRRANVQGGAPEAKTEACSRRDQAGRLPQSSGWRRWPEAVPGQSAPTREGSWV